MYEWLMMILCFMLPFSRPAQSFLWKHRGSQQPTRMHPNMITRNWRNTANLGGIHLNSTYFRPLFSLGWSESAELTSPQVVETLSRDTLEAKPSIRCREKDKQTPAWPIVSIITTNYHQKYISKPPNTATTKETFITRKESSSHDQCLHRCIHIPRQSASTWSHSK